jgi:hypothetical protein
VTRPGRLVACRSMAEPLTNAQRERALPLLEGRRLAYDGAMWNAPSLALIVQGLLLTALTQNDMPLSVGIVIAGAGMLMLAVVWLALWQLQDRVGHFRDRVQDHAEALGLGNPNRIVGRRKQHPLEWPLWKLWLLPFLGFAAADVLALACR